jgi:hypothetical protein
MANLFKAFSMDELHGLIFRLDIAETVEPPGRFPFVTS